MKLKFQELLPLPRGEGWGDGLMRAVVIRHAMRFLPTGKNTFYCVSSLMPPKAVLYLCVFLFLWFCFFLFCCNKRERNEHIKNILARYSHNIVYVDIYTKEKVSFDRGYQVSFETSYDSYTDTEYEDIAYKMSLLSDNNVYLGVYSSVPELSFYFEDLELANVLAIVFNQYSIWDWSASDEILNEYFLIHIFFFEIHFIPFFY